MKVAASKRFLCAVVITGAYITASHAQTAEYSTTDFGPVPAIEGGNPASSYALSNISHVNYFNGNLNITFRS
jgi:hypothetical protein